MTGSLGTGIINIYIMQKRSFCLRLRLWRTSAASPVDDIPVAAAFMPSLTTVRQPVEKMGNEAFVITLDAMQGKLKEIKELVYEPKLKARDSA